LFWTASDLEVGNITVTCNGTTKKINSKKKWKCKTRYKQKTEQPENPQRVNKTNK